MFVQILNSGLSFNSSTMLTSATAVARWGEGLQKAAILRAGLAPSRHGGRQRALDEEFGAPVRVGRRGGEVLDDGDCRGVSIDSSGRGEDEVLATALLHSADKVASARNVIFVVPDRLGNGLADGLEASKVDNSIKFGSREKGRHPRQVE